MIPKFRAWDTYEKEMLENVTPLFDDSNSMMAIITDFQIKGSPGTSEIEIGSYDTTFNWDEGVLICKQDKEGKNHIKRNLDPSHQGLIENMVDMGEKIGLVYTNMNERTTYLHVVSKDTLKTTETLKLESDKFSTYRYIMYRGGYIYLAGSTEDENYRGVLTIVDLANKSSKNIYTQKKEEFVSIHDKGDKLTLFACDSVRDENSGSSVYEFDKKRPISLKNQDMIYQLKGLFRRMTSILQLDTAIFAG